jgi:two-component system response regulator RegA
MTKALLILEDDLDLAEVLSKEFSERGYAVRRAQGLGEINAEALDYAIVDLRLTGEFGLNGLDMILQASPHCRVVILTGYGSVATALEAMKKGAADYLLKPAGIDRIEAALKGKGGVPKEEQKLKAPSLARMESEYIDYVLTRNDGNISKTARELGLHRQSLQRKLKKYPE